MMRPVASLFLLAVFALGASLCSRRLPARRQRASLSELVEHPEPTERPLSVEDAARIAQAWPANTPLVPVRLQ
jgi:hypothetical protein